MSQTLRLLNSGWTNADESGCLGLTEEHVYSGVPATVWVFVATFARPISQSFKWPFSVSSFGPSGLLKAVNIPHPAGDVKKHKNAQPTTKHFWGYSSNIFKKLEPYFSSNQPTKTKANPAKTKKAKKTACPAPSAKGSVKMMRRSWSRAQRIPAPKLLCKSVRDFGPPTYLAVPLPPPLPTATYLHLPLPLPTYLYLPLPCSCVFSCKYYHCVCY